jgi:hypothetical protein
LINLQDIVEVKQNGTEAGVMVEQCLSTLIDMVSGPNVENQIVLGRRKRLYDFISWLAGDRGVYRDSAEATELSQHQRSLAEAVKLLKALIEGCTFTNLQIPKIMIQQIDFVSLMSHST